jgi:prevent-host-death family protein
MTFVAVSCVAAPTGATTGCKGRRRHRPWNPRSEAVEELGQAPSRPPVFQRLRFPLGAIGLKEAKTNLSSFVDQSQRERILITRRGKPAAVVIGVEGQDLEQVLLGGDAEFWKMIQQRRQSAATLTSDDIRRSFDIETGAEPQTASRPKRADKGQRSKRETK